MSNFDPTTGFLRDGAHLCLCSEDSGPCEQHSEILVSREGASTRTADELALLLVEDLIDCGAEISPWGQHVLDAARHALEAHRDPISWTAWFGVEADGTDHYDALVMLADQLEADLPDADGPTLVIQNDGYVIVRVTGGPLVEAGGLYS